MFYSSHAFHKEDKYETMLKMHIKYLLVTIKRTQMEYYRGGNYRKFSQSYREQERREKRSWGENEK